MNGMSFTSSAVNTLYGVAPMSARDARISSVGPATQKLRRGHRRVQRIGDVLEMFGEGIAIDDQSGRSDVDVPGNAVARPTISIGTVLPLRSIEDGTASPPLDRITGNAPPPVDGSRATRSARESSEKASFQNAADPNVSGSIASRS
jgi:hypothetical protein